jgi:hypothetical protein
MTGDFGIVIGSLLTITLATGAVFVLARRARRSDKTAVLTSGVFFPMFVFTVGSLQTFSGQDVDGPPLGRMLLELFLGSATLTPITFLIAYLLSRTNFARVPPNVR